MRTKIAILVAGLAMGCLLTVLAQAWLRTSKRSESYVLQRDNNQDGRDDVSLIYSNGLLVEARMDRNFDGTADWIELFSDEVITHAYGDDDGDGTNDAWYDYKHGILNMGRLDTDSNGIPDMVVTFTNGVILKTICKPNLTSVVMKTEHFVGGVKRREVMYWSPTNSIVVDFDTYGMEVQRRERGSRAD